MNILSAYIGNKKIIGGYIGNKKIIGGYEPIYIEGEGNTPLTLSDNCEENYISLPKANISADKKITIKDYSDKYKSISGIKNANEKINIKENNVPNISADKFKNINENIVINDENRNTISLTKYQLSNNFTTIKENNDNYCGNNPLLKENNSDVIINKNDGNYKSEILCAEKESNNKLKNYLNPSLYQGAILRKGKYTFKSYSPEILNLNIPSINLSAYILDGYYDLFTGNTYIKVNQNNEVVIEDGNNNELVIISRTIYTNVWSSNILGNYFDITEDCYITISQYADFLKIFQPVEYFVNTGNYQLKLNARFMPFSADFIYNYIDADSMNTIESWYISCYDGISDEYYLMDDWNGLTLANKYGTNSSWTLESLYNGIINVTRGCSLREWDYIVFNQFFTKI